MAYSTQENMRIRENNVAAKEHSINAKQEQINQDSIRSASLRAELEAKLAKIREAAA
jgi:hypothetical protein